MPPDAHGKLNPQLTPHRGCTGGLRYIRVTWGGPPQSNCTISGSLQCDELIVLSTSGVNLAREPNAKIRGLNRIHANYSAARAVDGVNGTGFYASPVGAADKQWLLLDLGQEVALGSVAALYYGLLNVTDATSIVCYSLIWLDAQSNVLQENWFRSPADAYTFYPGQGDAAPAGGPAAVGPASLPPPVQPVLLQPPPSAQPLSPQAPDMPTTASTAALPALQEPQPEGSSAAVADGTAGACLKAMPLPVS